MIVINSFATIIQGAQAHQHQLELEATKIPKQPLLANAIVHKAPELVTLESLEQCWSYLVAVEPDIQPVQLLHQAPKKPNTWTPHTPSVVYLPGMTKGASVSDATFRMHGKKPKRWPDLVDLVIFRHEHNTEVDSPHISYTQSQKFCLYLALTPAAKDWNQTREKVLVADLARAKDLLDQSARQRLLVR